MRIYIRNVGYTSFARHTWEWIVTNDDWYPRQMVYATGKGHSRNDALGQARLKMTGIKLAREEQGWKEVKEKAE